jgi:hypothetical protein
MKEFMECLESLPFYTKYEKEFERMFQKVKFLYFGLYSFIGFY